MRKLQTLFREISGVFHQRRVKKTIRTYILEKVQRIVLAFFSTLSKSSLISTRLRFQSVEHGFFLRDTYYVTHNAGLMSCASTTLSDIYQAKRPIKNISSTFGMSLYKSQILTNNWEKFFEANGLSKPVDDIPQTEGGSLKIHDWWSSQYNKLPLDLIQSQIKTHFVPSKEVKILQDTYVEKYSIRLQDAVGVHYRGTDKAIEIETPSLQQFIERTRSYLEDIPTPQILLLTDEPSAQEAFRAAFPGLVSVIDELEAPGGTAGAHNVDSTDPEAKGQIFLAILLLISKCRKVITHTGNGALWEFIFRNNPKGIVQIFADLT